MDTDNNDTNTNTNTTSDTDTPNTDNSNITNPNLTNLEQALKHNVSYAQTLKSNIDTLQKILKQNSEKQVMDKIVILFYGSNIITI